MITTALESMLTLQWLESKVRMQVIDGKSWYVARDVCAAIGLAHGREACRALDRSEKGVSIADTPGGRQEMMIISESGMLSLLMRSRKPRAKAFQQWVTGEVIPTIRRTGTYSIRPPSVDKVKVNPDTLATLATDWAESKKKVTELRQTGLAIIDCVKPVAELAGLGRMFVEQPGEMQMGMLARLLYSLGAQCGRNQLYTALRAQPFDIFMPIGESRQPKMEYIRKGWFTVHTVQYEKPVDGGRSIKCVDVTPYITPKGFKALWPKFQEVFKLWQVAELDALKAFELHLQLRDNPALGPEAG